MNRSEDIEELAAALAKAQAMVKPALKDNFNPHYKSKFADFSSVLDACEDALNANNLALIQAPISNEHGAGVETMICHSSGQWISEILILPTNKLDAQGLGSCITYARRFSLEGFMRIRREDDDGNAAVAPAKQKERPPEKAKPEQPKATLTPTEKETLANLLEQAKVPKEERPKWTSHAEPGELFTRACQKLRGMIAKNAMAAGTAADKQDHADAKTQPRGKPKPGITKKQMEAIKAQIEQLTFHEEDYVAGILNAQFGVVQLELLTEEQAKEFGDVLGDELLKQEAAEQAREVVPS